MSDSEDESVSGSESGSDYVNRVSAVQTYIIEILSSCQCYASDCPPDTRRAEELQLWDTLVEAANYLASYFLPDEPDFSGHPLYRVESIEIHKSYEEDLEDLCGRLKGMLYDFATFLVSEWNNELLFDVMLLITAVMRAFSDIATLSEIERRKTSFLKNVFYKQSF